MTKAWTNTAATVPRALRMSPAPVAVTAAVRALAAGGALLVAGAVIGDWDRLGVAYLGAACSVAFVIGDDYRGRVAALAAASVGAAIGIVIGGVVDHTALLMVAVAVGAGVVSGLLGAAGPHGPAFGMMLSIGVAYGQFVGSGLAPSAQVVWYLVGAFVVGFCHVVDWPFRRGVAQRRAAVGVYAAAAELCAAIGTPDASDARRRLVAASSTARTAGWTPQTQNIAYAAAALYTENRPVGREVVDALHDAGAQVGQRRPLRVPTAWPPTTPGLRAMATALDGDDARPAVRDHRGIGAIAASLRTRTACLNAIRIALCMGVATAVTLTIHAPQHAFWLPLTVAVIVRPEYASIVVRTVNRLAGTIVGAVVAAAVVAVWPSGIGVAVAASIGLAFAALTAPKLYGLSVIGVTLSALLSSSVGGPDVVGPEVRLLDTFIGAVIAVVFGYLLWPGARRLPQQARVDDGLDAAEAYLEEALQPAPRHDSFARCRDDAYRFAHAARLSCLAAFAEPPPTSDRAREMLPCAIELEEIVDAITQISIAVDTAAGSDRDIVRTRERLRDLRSRMIDTRRE
ncbi:FUSC family protein [Gordonia sp. CPCC 205515]|uniref:FUSC family protein n=1 Tax=Gordonia sp. CPCC 205515 TaxID=3140791 RepID=UPI003AF367F0